MTLKNLGRHERRRMRLHNDLVAGNGAPAKRVAAAVLEKVNRTVMVRRPAVFGNDGL